MERMEIFDFSFNQNDYVKNIKNIKKSEIKDVIFCRILEKDKNPKITDVLDIINVMGDKENTLSMFFGIEDFIGSSNYSKISEFIENEKSLAENVFVILSKCSTLFFLLNEKSVSLLEELQPFFLIENKDDFVHFEKISNKIKIKGIFLSGKEMNNLSLAEIKWVESNVNKLLVDTSDIIKDSIENMLSGKRTFKTIYFNLNKTEKKFYHRLV
jgi:hypothetical protein